MTLVLAVAAFTTASAAVNFLGHSAINVNGTWYGTDDETLGWSTCKGAFNDANLGIFANTLPLGGQSQTWENGNVNWGSGTVTMNYRISNSESDLITSSINLTYYQYANNNNYFQSGGNNFSLTSVNISELEDGEYNLSVWFNCGDTYDSRNGANYNATFTVDSSHPNIGTIQWNTADGGFYEIDAESDLHDLAVYVNGTGNYYTGAAETTAHNCWGKTFKQTADITLTKEHTAIGKDLDHQFQGVFNGNDWKISNLTIEKSNNHYQGLFGFTNNATIKNVNIVECDIEGQNHTGGIIGYNYVGSTIENCTVTGNIKGSANCGGIVGCSNSGTIKNCFSAATVEGYSYVGSIVGDPYSTNLTNNFHLATTTGGVGASGVATGTDRTGAEVAVRILSGDNVNITYPANPSYEWNNENLYKSGTVVTLDYDLPDGKFFDRYSVNSGEISNAGTMTGEHTLTGFTEDVTISGSYYDMTLADNATDNSSTISRNNGQIANVTLDGRTLYKDGDWNTICLPFNVTLANSPLAGATAKTLTSASLDNGTLELNFGSDVEELTAGTPYIIKWDADADLTIKTDNDWNDFVNSVNTSQNTYEGKVVSLANDITVTYAYMLGSESHKFKGTFEGNGHTLTFNAKSYNSYCAPFRYVDGATIKNLHITGTIETGSHKFASGLIGESLGTVTVDNCWSSVTINSDPSNNPSDTDGTHGGFVAVVNSGSVTMTNCLFDGEIKDETNATTNCAGFMGWHKYEGSVLTEVTFNNCLMAGTLSINVDGNSATFTRNGDNNATFNKCYYTTALSNDGVNQGNAAGDDLANDLGNGWKESDNKVVPVFEKLTTTITDPTFANVTIDDTDHSFRSSDRKVAFQGSYDAQSFETEYKSILFLGADNTLYWPQSGASIGACRAYFKIITDPQDGGGDVRKFVLNFGDGEETQGIESLTPNPSRGGEGSIYNLNGVKVEKPVRKGLYIQNGKKIVVH